MCIAVVGCISIGSIVTGAYGGSFGLKNEDGKCIKYVSFGVLGIRKWLYRHPDKKDDFDKWFEDLSKHFVDEDEKLSYDYVCASIAIPTFVFALVQCVAIILFFVDIILSCKSLGRVGI